MYARRPAPRPPLWMRALSFCVAGLLIVPTASLADPSVAIHWNTCTGPINVGPGSGPIQHIVVSADNLGAPILGFEIVLYLASPVGGLADAWRFDPGGCEAGRFQSVQQSLGPSCPSLVIPNAHSLSDYSYLPQSGGPHWLGRITYAEESLTTPSAAPGARNALVEFLLDQSNASLAGTSADSCGCLGRPLCISIADAQYIDAQGDVHTIFAQSQPFLTWNDPFNSKTMCGGGGDCSPGPCLTDSLSCSGDLPTPANGTSWGHVKGMYRDRVR